MKCPKCGTASSVYETRRSKDGKKVTRRRLCASKACGHRWKTVETAARRLVDAQI